MAASLPRPQEYISNDMAALLLVAMKMYVERHNLTPSALSQRATGSTKTMERMQAGGRVRRVTAAKITAFIADNPEPLPFRKAVPAGEGRSFPSPERNLPPRVDRDPCARCGVQGDIGCDHRIAPWTPGIAA